MSDLLCCVFTCIINEPWIRPQLLCTQTNNISFLFNTKHRLSTMHGMQGNCSEPLPNTPSARGRSSGTQCRIIVSNSFLKTSEDLWIHDLYLQVDNSTSSQNPSTTLLEVSGAELWLTSSVLAGDQSGQTSRGVHVTDSGLFYARGAPSSLSVHIVRLLLLVAHAQRLLSGLLFRGAVFLPQAPVLNLGILLCTFYCLLKYNFNVVSSFLSHR